MPTGFSVSFDRRTFAVPNAHGHEDILLVPVDDV